MGQDEANAIIAKANALHNAGKKLEAAPMYVEAAGLFAPYATFCLVSGDSYAAAGQHEQAVEAYRICVADNPEHEQALDGLVRSLQALGRTEEADKVALDAGRPAPSQQKKGFFARLFGR